MDEFLSGAVEQQSGHERHCFVVMPFGRNHSEQRWFRGWYDVVIKPAIIEAGYDPKLSAAEEQPGAINDEIRAHLAFDPMVVVDLGGAEPEDDPNPNVMYELGIRHALGLPLVLMAWKGQRLPFDVSNQRIIVEDRDLVDLEINKKRLVSFIHAAKNGNYYKPMEAVGRTATISAATAGLGEDSLLKALVDEIRDLKTTVHQVSVHKRSKEMRNQLPTVKKLINGKVFRKDLYPHFVDLGGDASSWARLLRIQIDPSHVETMQAWDDTEWKKFIEDCWEGTQSPYSIAPEKVPLDAALLKAIEEIMPMQPWPQGVHLEAASKIGIKPTLATKYIKELIKRGIFKRQVNGMLMEGENN